MKLLGDEYSTIENHIIQSCYKQSTRVRNHGRPQKFFQGGGKVDILLSFLVC